MAALMRAVHLQAEKPQFFRIFMPRAIMTSQAFASELSREIASSTAMVLAQATLSLVCRAVGFIQTVTALRAKLCLKKQGLKSMIRFQS